jgi:hypothetical protein
VATKTQSQLHGAANRKDDVTGASYHFVVAGWETEKAESRALENDNSLIKQFNEPLAFPVASSKWLLDTQSLEMRRGSMCS